MGDAERCDARSNEGAAQVRKAVVAEGVGLKRLPNMQRAIQWVYTFHSHAST